MLRGSRLAKLRAMPPCEISARLAYRGYVLAERELYRRGVLAPPDRLRRALVRDLARSNWQQLLIERERRGLFFAGFDDCTATRARFASQYHEELGKARRVADEVARHEIEFFGKRFSFGRRIDWHADPVTRAQWPQTYHLDVPVLGGDRGFGDVKYVWELNRHQFLIDLAKIVLLDDSERHRRVLRDLIIDWQREVPYATGAAWACALEPAFRVWSWLWAYHLVQAAEPLEPAFHVEWLTGFYDHGRFLNRHLETYTSPYNHLIGEASALFAVGLLFPEFKEASGWVARGREVLESTLASQFHSDGGSVEQSTFYHHATLGFYLQAALLARRNGVDLSESCWNAIERGIAFSMSVVQPDGHVPRIGGADDGKPIRLEHLPLYDFRPYQAIGAVLFSRGDFKYVAGRFWEDALWLLGTEGADLFAGLEAKAPPPSVGLQASGYYIGRSAWSPDGDYLCFDCGPQAAGLRRDHVPSAAHGHADCLSVVAVLGGREVLVDPGFFCYNGDPEWEVHFRKTQAHNTAVVDGTDQAQHLSKMAWTRTFTPSVEGWSGNARLAWARGSHDGFSRLTEPVIHRRTAWLRPDGYLVLYDEISGEGRHDVDLNFQFAPGTLVTGADDHEVVFEKSYRLRWATNLPLMASIAAGGERATDGWIAPSLGVREAAPRLTLRASLTTGRLVVMTVLADDSRTQVRPSAQSGGDMLGTTLEGRSGWVDDVLAANSGNVRLPGLETDAPLVVLRWLNGILNEACQAGGTRIAVTDALRSRPLGAGHRPALAVR